MVSRVLLHPARVHPAPVLASVSVPVLLVHVPVAQVVLAQVVPPAPVVASVQAVQVVLRVLPVLPVQDSGRIVLQLADAVADQAVALPARLVVVGDGQSPANPSGRSAQNSN